MWDLHLDQGSDPDLLHWERGPPLATGPPGKSPELFLFHHHCFISCMELSLKLFYSFAHLLVVRPPLLKYTPHEGRIAISRVCCCTLERGCVLDP